MPVNLLRLSVAAIVSLAAIAAPPHAVYGPLEVRRGDVIRVDLATGCNVYALDTFNYEQYKKGRKFQYSGGLATGSPFILKPPRGSYLVIIETGGEGAPPAAAVRVIHHP